ncbi:hypothetical protein [Emticicia sp. 17c]|uniref:hypothetical protein n=1 Tax=Emticicia sp. 17c TaxID=3127704 RepID=UPI00301D754C
MKAHKQKFSAIANIWRNHIYGCQFFESKFNLSEVKGNNYFGDLVTYFNDLESIITTEDDGNLSENFSHDFKNTISFLQAIFIQQDFVIEMLSIFKCSKALKRIRKDSNFKSNRDIRNELVGHPIKRNRSTNAFLSSAIFSSELKINKIAYMIYSKDNNFKSKHIIIEREVIINRHQNLLNYYFDLILEKLKDVLKEYKNKLTLIKNSLSDSSFENLLAELHFNYDLIFDSESLFHPKILMKLKEKMNLHPRYKSSIEHFYNTLNNYLEETISLLEDWINWKVKDEEIKDKIVNVALVEYPLFNDINEELFDLGDVQYVDSSNQIPTISNDHDDYIISKFHGRDMFFANYFKKKYKNSKNVIYELEYMKANINDDLEYHSSLHYLCKLLGKE